MNGLPTTPHDITPEWLTEALGIAVATAVVQDVITGAATKVRVHASARCPGPLGEVVASD